jgi:serine/threonine protein kinase
MNSEEREEFKEVLGDAETYHASDLWALGISLIEILLGRAVTDQELKEITESHILPYKKEQHTPTTRNLDRIITALRSTLYTLRSTLCALRSALCALRSAL